VDYKEAGEQLYQLVKKVWKKVDSRFYPGMSEEIKLTNIRTGMINGDPKRGFWRLFDFLTKDLLAVSKQDFSEEIKEVFKILESIDDQKEVLAKITSLVKKEVYTKNKSIKAVSIRGLTLLQGKALSKLEKP